MEGVERVKSTGAEVLAADLDLILSLAEDEFRMLASSKLILTGGAGFLGYSLVSSICEFNRRNSGSKISLYVLDNYFRGCPPWLEQAARETSVHLIPHDITRALPADLPNVDFVIHAASIASPTYYRQHPIETMDANVQGLRNLLDQCVAWAGEGKPVKAMLFFSSSEIYGDPAPGMVPTPETYFGSVSCTGPRACYDESKRYGETLCVNFAHVHGIPVKITRPFNNYGPGLKLSDKRVIPDFCRSILAGDDITILSTGAPTRTFSYVADAVVGYLKILTRGRPGEAYNIGTEKPEVSVRELADLLVQIARDSLGYRGQVRFANSPDPDYLTDNPQRRCPDLTKARNELGYTPQVSLRDGLHRTLSWYADNQQWGDER
jgi:UDP-glucuronate decarboxylase